MGKECLDSCDEERDTTGGQKQNYSIIYVPKGKVHSRRFNGQTEVTSSSKWKAARQATVRHTGITYGRVDVAPNSGSNRST